MPSQHLSDQALLDEFKRWLEMANHLERTLRTAETLPKGERLRLLGSLPSANKLGEFVASSGTLAGRLADRFPSLQFSSIINSAYYVKASFDTPLDFGCNLDSLTNECDKLELLHDAVYYVLCPQRLEYFSNRGPDPVDEPYPWVPERKLSEVKEGPRASKTPAASGTEALVILRSPTACPVVRGKEKRPLTTPQYNVVKALMDAGEHGLTGDELVNKSGHGGAVNVLKALARSDADWGAVISLPGRPGGRYRLRLTEIDGHADGA